MPILRLKSELLSCEGGVLITSIFNAYNFMVDLFLNNPCAAHCKSNILRFWKTFFSMSDFHAG